MKEGLPVPKVKAPEIPISEIAEWLQDEPGEVQALFHQLPRGLWGRHYEAVEGRAQVPEKVKYLEDVLERRKEKRKEFKSNDPRFRDLTSEEQLGDDLYGLLESPENMLGAGGTARVKRYRFQETLSAEGEHDMLWEVDTVTSIEEAERKIGVGTRVRVPHPYFYYKDQNIQCYAMEEINGRNVEQLIDTKVPTSAAEVRQREAVWEALRQRYSDPAEQEALYKEVEKFVNAMHAVCLHKDIKPANVMVDEEGTIYLIDFGQSKNITSINDKTPDQIQNLQDDEHSAFRQSVGHLLERVGREKLAA